MKRENEGENSPCHTETQKDEWKCKDEMIPAKNHDKYHEHIVPTAEKKLFTPRIHNNIT